MCVGCCLSIVRGGEDEWEEGACVGSIEKMEGGKLHCLIPVALLFVLH